MELARCVKHPGGYVAAESTYETASGRRRQYRCTPPVGAPHWFSVPIDDAGVVAQAWSPPPACPEHPGSKVVRNGKYGKTTAKPRQRYRCAPADGSPAHSFTPELPRDHVHEGYEQCDLCDQHRQVHHGETTAAWSHSWNTRLVAEGLERLSRGDSYAEVSRWARRVSGTDEVRTRRVVRDGELTDPDRSDAARLRRNAWHTAADWVEAFGPVVFEELDARLRARALAERARLDGLLEQGEPLDRPQVLLLDDVPVYGRTLDRAARRDDGFYLLVTAEQVTDETGVTRPTLRLVRAMPKSNRPAWRLVFDELGYAPDVIVADAGTGIGAAVRAHFDPDRTRLVPSMWHITRKVEEALAASGGTAEVDGRTRLLEPLGRHLRLLSRRSGVFAEPGTWAAWWDELETLTVGHRLPLDKVRSKRRIYEKAVADILDLINDHPDLPTTTGGLETLIDRRVKPMLASRRHAFGNLERTNLLFDLVVCRDHHVFDRLAEVAELLRRDTLDHEGRTVALRTVEDPRPPKGTYSSLRDEHRLYRIAQARGLT